MKSNTAKAYLHAMAAIFFIVLAYSAPEIALSHPAPAMIGYLASFGFLCFGIRFFIIIGWVVL